MCPTSIPNLGAKDVCFPKVLSGWQPVLSQQGIQEPGQVAWQQSPAQPPLLLPADPTPHCGDQQTPTERTQTWAGLILHLPRLHLSHTHHTQPS